MSEDIVNFEVGPEAAHAHVVDEAIMWFAGAGGRETCVFCAAQPEREPRYATVVGIDKDIGKMTVCSQESGVDAIMGAPPCENIQGGKHDVLMARIRELEAERTAQQVRAEAAEKIAAEAQQDRDDVSKQLEAMAGELETMVADWERAVRLRHWR